MKVEDLSELNAEEQHREDEISDPEEDTIAGQMAAMRGAKIKKIGDEDDSDESGTDDDEEEESDSSDSD